MIPASYFFRDAYRQRFEADPAEILAAMEQRPTDGVSRGPFDGMLIALIGAAFGSANYVLGAQARPHASAGLLRRR